MRRLLLALIALASVSLAADGPDRPAVFTPEQATAGKILIRQNLFGNCTDCHATALTGRNGSPGELPPLESLRDDYQKLVKGNGGIVPPFVGPDFVAKWGPRSTQALIKEFEDRFNPPLTTEARLNLIAYILEINGAGSEATHIWDRDARLRDAYATLFLQVRLAFEIGAAHRRAGLKPMRGLELLRVYRAERRMLDSYPPDGVEDAP